MVAPRPTRPDPTTPNPGVPEKAPTPPSPGRALFAAVVALAVATAAFTGFVFVWRWNESQDACRARVEARVDGRAMFEYLVQTAEHPDDPRVLAFQVELDERLPLLQCINNKPTPIGD